MPEKDVPTQPRYLELRSIILICIAVFFFLSGVTFLLCYNHYLEAKRLSLKEDRATARLLSMVLDEHIRMITKTMESYTSRPLLLRAVRDKNVEKTREHLSSMIKNEPYTESLAITDREGTLWASYPERPEVIGKNFAYREWYKGVSRDWKPYVSDVILRVVAEKDLAVQIGVPFIDEKGEITGILVNTQRAVCLAKIMQQVTVDPGTSIGITDRKGNMVFSSRFAYEKESTPYPFYSVKDRLTSSAKGHSAAVADHLLGGRTRYISYAPVAGIGWSVFVGRDSRQIVMSGLSHYIQTGAIALALFLLTVLSLVYYRKRVMAERLLKRIRADEEIRKERDQAQMYLDVAAVMIVALNTEGHIVLINRKGCEILGYTEQEIIGQNWFDVCLPEEMREEVTGVFKKLMAGDIAPVEYHENTVLTKDGESRTLAFHNTILHDRSYQIIGILSSGEDITEHRQAEAELKESKTLVEAIVENVPLMIFLKEAKDLRFVIFNRAGEELLGYDRNDLIGKNNLDLFPPEQAAHFMAKDREVLDGEIGMLDIPEEPILTARKGQRLLHTRKVCIRGSDGVTKFLLGISDDITERKQAEEELITSARKLRKSLVGTIQVVSMMLETRDPYTGGHQGRVSNLARSIAQEMGLPDDTVDTIRMAGTIHDIGKMSVPAEILSKPSRLTDIEMKLLEVHPRTGYDILKVVELPSPIAEIVLQHHERLDGSGYPQGLKNGEILLEAQIMAVADVVEAMASHRPYRPALGIDAALEEIEKNKGILYDERVVGVCLKLFREKGFTFD